MEDGLGEGVEVGEDLAAFGAEGVRVVEDRGDAALLIERWEPVPESAPKPSPGRPLTLTGRIGLEIHQQPW